MPMQSVPAMAAMSVLITLIGGGLYAVDKYIDPRNLPNNARGNGQWNHEMWLRDMRLEKEAAEAPRRRKAFE